MILSRYAWRAFENARPRSGIPVGAAVLTDGGAWYSGCNIELEFRLGMHAEVNALSTMLADSPSSKPVALTIAAARPTFGPCGGCLDWIVQLNPGCQILHYDTFDHCASIRTARDYLPFYPSKESREAA